MRMGQKNLNGALSDQGQGHGTTLKFFSIYHNAKVKSYILALTLDRKKFIR